MESASASKPGPIVMNGQVLHSISAERLALVRSLDNFVEEEVSQPVLCIWTVCWALLPLSLATDLVPGRRQPRVRCSCAVTCNFNLITSACPRHDHQLARVSRDHATTQVTPILKPVDKCWQPTDFLPPSEDADFLDKVRAGGSCAYAWAPQRH